METKICLNFIRLSENQLMQCGIGGFCINYQFSITITELVDVFYIDACDPCNKYIAVL